MSVEYFDEQRRQLIAAIRAHTEQVAIRIGKTALDKQVLRAIRGPIVRLSGYAPADRFR